MFCPFCSFKSEKGESLQLRFWSTAAFCWQYWDRKGGRRHAAKTGKSGFKPALVAFCLVAYRSPALPRSNPGLPPVLTSSFKMKWKHKPVSHVMAFMSILISSLRIRMCFIVTGLYNTTKPLQMPPVKPFTLPGEIVGNEEWRREFKITGGRKSSLPEVFFCLPSS